MDLKGRNLSVESFYLSQKKTKTTLRVTNSSFEGCFANISRQSQNFTNDQNRIFLRFNHLLCRNSCFAGPEYEVGDGVFDVRVCQYDTPIGKMMQCTIFLEKSITNEKDYLSIEYSDESLSMAGENDAKYNFLNKSISKY